MNRPDCNHYETCNAPMCPYDENLNKMIWYPDEDICKKRDVPNWVKKQRKIAGKIREKSGYFTLEMLDRHFRITKALKGLDPNKDEVPQLERWKDAHPEITEEEMERLKERGRKLQARLQNERGVSVGV